MASDTSVPQDATFLSQVERVRVELRERVARVHQVLQERDSTAVRAAAARGYLQGRGHSRTNKAIISN